MACQLSLGNIDSAGHLCELISFGPREEIHLFTPGSDRGGEREMNTIREIDGFNLVHRRLDEYIIVILKPQRHW